MVRIVGLERKAIKASGIYRGYMPTDLPQHRPRNRIKPWEKIRGKPRVTLYPKQPTAVGFSDQPEYPPLIFVDDHKSLIKQKRLEWYDSIKSLPTFDQKMYEIGHHIKHKMAHINNYLQGYNSLPMAQYITQTHVINSLPEGYDGSESPETHQNLKTMIRDHVLQQIAVDLFESKKLGPVFVANSVRDRSRMGYMTKGVLQNIAFKLKSVMEVYSNPDLKNYIYDRSPAMRSWWYFSKLRPPVDQRFYRVRMDGDGFVNTMLQLDASSALNIRSSSFLPPIVPQTDDVINKTDVIDKYEDNLKSYGAIFKFKRPVALAGYWFDDNKDYDFPHTCLLTTDCLKLRQSKNYENVKNLDDMENCLTTQSILTSFGWLNTLAMYHGFTPFQEITYPFTCQTITTDGQHWLFNIYQLNTIAFHRDLASPKKNNLCWTSGVIKLFESYEDGEFKGVDMKPIELLMSFMDKRTSPEYTLQINLRPYLGEDTRTEDEKQEAMSKLRYLYEQRGSRWLSTHYRVPLFEHLFFRSHEMRKTITHTKPKWKIPPPHYPKIFD